MAQVIKTRNQTYLLKYQLHCKTQRIKNDDFRGYLYQGLILPGFAFSALTSARIWGMWACVHCRHVIHKIKPQMSRAGENLQVVLPSLNNVMHYKVILKCKTLMFPLKG